MQRSTSFSHELGDAFQIFYCVSFEGLLVVGIHAKVLPAVAVEVFRGTGLATRATATVVIDVPRLRIREFVSRQSRACGRARGQASLES